MHLSPDRRSRPVRAPLLRARLIVPLLLAVLVGAFALVAIPLLHGRAGAPASATGSAPLLPEGAVQSLSIPGTTTYLGAIPGTQAFLGLVRTGQRARAYVCDGRPGQHPSLSDWFAGPVSNGNVQAKSQQGDQLSVQLSAQNASGTLTLAGGRAFSFTVPVVTNPGQAGVFEGTERVQGQLVHVGWLVLPNGDQRGSSSGALLPVTSTADGPGICPSSANCTLRQAITQAASGQTIIFRVRGTITLKTQQPLTINSNVANLTISGPGAGALAISGNGQTTVFLLQPGSSAEITGLTIRDGVPGGSTDGAGSGGVTNDGTLRLLHSVLTANVSPNNGGAVDNQSNATLTMEFCTVSGNGSGGNGGGISNEGTIDIAASIISNNSASSGGGLYNENQGTMLLNEDTLSSNVAKNTASGGGGIENEGNLSVLASTFAHNRANTGGGLRNPGVVTVHNSTFFGNTANIEGGAIALFPDTFVLSSNSRIRSAVKDIVQNSTIAGNTTLGPFGGGGIFFDLPQSFLQEYLLGSSIVANNTTLSGGASPDILGRFISLGHNLVGRVDSGSSGYVSSDQRGSTAHPLNPRLGALANNGGLTQTLALLPGSPAIAHGDCQLGAPATPTRVDQRNDRRKTFCDTGAFETLGIASGPAR